MYDVVGTPTGLMHGIENSQTATLDRVEKTGTGAGARNLETTGYLCFYASYGETQSGQADVICRNKANTYEINFEAWLK